MSSNPSKFTKIVPKRKCIYGEEYSVLKKFKVPKTHKQLSIDQPNALVNQLTLEKLELRPNIQFEQNLKKNIKSVGIVEKKHKFNEQPIIRPVAQSAIVEKFYCNLDVCKKLVFICRKCYCINMCTIEKCFFGY